MKIVFLGAPGSGKGTHAQKLSKQFAIPHISTGDIFRSNIREKTPLGLKVKEILAKGLLVSDDITVEIVKNRLTLPDCSKGFILDGFPRSIFQAEALERFQDIDTVLHMTVTEDEIVSRMSGRRFCSGCNAIYHISQHKSGKCFHCQTELSIRNDDEPETVAERYKIYCDSTFPLVDFYKTRGILHTIQGVGSIDEVYDRILKALGK